MIIRSINHKANELSFVELLLELLVFVEHLHSQALIDHFSLNNISYILVVMPNREAEVFPHAVDVDTYGDLVIDHSLESRAVSRRVFAGKVNEDHGIYIKYAVFGLEISLVELLGDLFRYLRVEDLMSVKRDVDLSSPNSSVAFKVKFNG